MQDLQNIGAIVLARMDSARFPGKVLADLAGKPVIARVLERLHVARDTLTPIVVATTRRQVDAPIAAWCRDHRILAYLDDHDPADVAGRFVRAARLANLPWAARVNADSPLVDAGLIASALPLCRPPVQLVTNLKPRQFPLGVAVEIIHIDSMEQELRDFTAEEREHVTLGLYRRWNDAQIASIGGGNSTWPAIRMTIDEPADLERMCAFIEAHHHLWPIVPLRDLVAWGRAGVRG